MPLKNKCHQPYILGTTSLAYIGSCKIIFDIRENVINDSYDYLVLHYPEPFTFKIKKRLYPNNLSKNKWYNNFSYTYREYKKGYGYTIKLYHNKKIIEQYDDKNTDFQFGDDESLKIILSNGDILFNNYGDVESSLL